MAFDGETKRGVDEAQQALRRQGSMGCLKGSFGYLKMEPRMSEMELKMSGRATRMSERGPRMSGTAPALDGETKRGSQVELHPDPAREAVD